MSKDGEREQVVKVQALYGDIVYTHREYSTCGDSGNVWKFGSWWWCGCWCWVTAGRLGEHLVLECGWSLFCEHSSLWFIIKGEEMGRHGWWSRDEGAVLFGLLLAVWGHQHLWGHSWSSLSEHIWLSPALWLGVGSPLTITDWLFD